MRTCLILFTALLFTASCKNTWDDEDKNAFYQSCIDDANHWAGNKAKPYCDCMMDKMMKKYPNESDALEHMDSVINDPDLRGCKAEVMGK